MRHLWVRRRAILIVKLSLNSLLIVLLLFDEQAETVEQELLVVSLEHKLVLQHLHHMLVGSRHRIVVIEKEDQYNEARNGERWRAKEEDDVAQKIRQFLERLNCAIPSRIETAEWSARPRRHYFGDRIDHRDDRDREAQQQNNHEERVGSAGTVENRRRFRVHETSKLLDVEHEEHQQRCYGG